MWFEANVLSPDVPDCDAASSNVDLYAYCLEADPIVAAQAAARAETLGLSGWFTGETNFNALVPAALAAAGTTSIRIGTAVAVAFARSPMTMAYAANDLQNVSGGRFVLGLGSQVRAHIRRRFNMPWSAPTDRMREYVAALNAIWTSWQTGEELQFEGQYYSHTLMTDFFAGRVDHPAPALALAALGEGMTELAGEVADLFLAAPLATPRYLAEVNVPALKRGAGRVGRASGSPEVAANVMVVTGRDEREFAELAATTRRQIAFYASTPTYRRVLDVHGQAALGGELSELARRGRFEEMPALIEDDLLSEFAVVTESPSQVGDVIKRRYGAVADRVMLYPHWRPSDEDLAGVAADLRR